MSPNCGFDFGREILRSGRHDLNPRRPGTLDATGKGGENARCIAASLKFRLLCHETAKVAKIMDESAPVSRTE